MPAALYISAHKNTPNISNKGGKMRVNPKKTNKLKYYRNRVSFIIAFYDRFLFSIFNIGLLIFIFFIIIQLRDIIFPLLFTFLFLFFIISLLDSGFSNLWDIITTQIRNLTK